MFVIGKIAEAIILKKKSKVTGIIGLTSLAFLIAIIASVITLNVVAIYKEKIADELILKIENYRQLNAEYPKTLDELKIQSKSIYFEDIKYSTDSSRQYFRIGFSFNGWNFSAYDSDNKKWITSGD